MKDFPVALQLYSVRDDLQSDFAGTLHAVREMGYDGVEFAGLFGHTPAEVRDLCKAEGLVALSAHIAYPEMMSNENIFREYAEIGCTFAAVPHIGLEYRTGGEKHREFLDSLSGLGKRAKEAGIQLCYHNHDFEFVKEDGEYALDRMYEYVPAEYLETELDTCWVNVGGENPAEYLRKYAGRARIVHLKDFAGQKSENMYALIGVDENEKKDTGGKFEFRPVGYGLQNIPEILAAAKDAGSQWMIVEQDQPSLGKTPLECAKMSIDYLNSL